MLTITRILTTVLSIIGIHNPRRQAIKRGDQRPILLGSLILTWYEPGTADGTADRETRAGKRGYYVTIPAADWYAAGGSTTPYDRYTGEYTGGYSYSLYAMPSGIWAWRTAAGRFLRIHSSGKKLAPVRACEPAA